MRNIYKCKLWWIYHSISHLQTNWCFTIDIHKNTIFSRSKFCFINNQFHNYNLCIIKSNYMIDYLGDMFSQLISWWCVRAVISSKHSSTWRRCCQWTTAQWIVDGHQEMPGSEDVQYCSSLLVQASPVCKRNRDKNNLFIWWR